MVAGVSLLLSHSVFLLFDGEDATLDGDLKFIDCGFAAVERVNPNILDFASLTITSSTK